MVEESMLNVIGANNAIMELIVEIDEYVPLRARINSGSSNISYLRLGGSKTSLLEIPIDLESGTMLGVDLVLFDLVSTKMEMKQPKVCAGLPIIDIHCFGQTKYIVQRRDFFVSIHDNEFFIDWSGNAEIDMRYDHLALSFYTSAEIVVGVSVRNLNPNQIEILHSHMREAQSTHMKMPN